MNKRKILVLRSTSELPYIGKLNLLHEGEEGGGAAPEKKDVDLTPEQRTSIDTKKAELLKTAPDRLKTISGVGDIKTVDAPPAVNYQEKYEQLMSDPYLSKLAESKLAGADIAKMFSAIPAAHPIDVSKIDKTTLYTQSLQGKNYTPDEVELLVDKFKKKAPDEQESVVSPIREELKKSASSQSPEILSFIENTSKAIAPISQKESETYNQYVSTIENTIKVMKDDAGKELPADKVKELADYTRMFSGIKPPVKRDGTLIGTTPENLKTALEKAQRVVFYDQHMQAAYALGIEAALDPRVRANADLGSGAKVTNTTEKDKKHIVPEGFNQLGESKVKFGPKT